MEQDRFEEILRAKLRDYEPDSFSASASEWLLLSQAIVTKKTLLGSALLGKLLLSPKSSIIAVKTAATTVVVAAAVTTTLYLTNNSSIKKTDIPTKNQQEIIAPPDSIPPQLEAAEVFRHELAQIREREIAKAKQPKDAGEQHVDLITIDDDASFPISYRDYSDKGEEKREKQPKPVSVSPQDDDIMIVRSSNWSLSLFADRALSSIASNPKSYVAPNNSINEIQLRSTRDNIASAASANLKHQIPVTVGIALQRKLINNWAIETGVTYSFLGAKADMNAMYNYSVKQNSHFIGIPLGASYTLVRSNRWEVYGRLGIQADFNLNTQRTVAIRADNGDITSVTDNFRVKNVQWSSSLGAGVIYNVSPVWGVYLEPGVVHYFTNDAPNETFWSQNPTNLNVKFGVRKNF